MFRTSAITALLLASTSIISIQSANAFDCRKAKNRAEHTVCGSASLRYIDEQLNVEYGYAKLYARSKWFKRRLISTQRRWMRKRNRCGSSRPCLHRVYARRLAYLENTYQNGN